LKKFREKGDLGRGREITEKDGDYVKEKKVHEVASRTDVLPEGTGLEGSDNSGVSAST